MGLIDVLVGAMRGMGSSFTPMLVVLVGVLFLVASTAVNCFFCHAEGSAVALVEWGRGLGQLAAVGLSALLGFSLFGYVATFYGALLIVSFGGAAAYFARWGFNPFVLLARGRRGARAMLRTGRVLIGEALLQGLVHAGSIINLNIGAIVVARELSLADAGIYAVMMRLFGAALTMHLAVISPYWAAFTVKFTTGERDWMARSVRMLALTTTAVWAVGLVAVLFAGPWMTEVLVQERIESKTIWLLFSAWALFAALTNLHNMVLQSVGRISRLAVLVVISAGLHLVLASLLGRFLGVQGIIGATISVTALLLGFSGVEAWRLMGSASSGEPTGKEVGCSAESREA
jgi:O-antigen/teichoic acid export membrane protein